MCNTQCTVCGRELKLVNDDQWGYIMDLYYYCFKCSAYRGEANKK